MPFYLLGVTWLANPVIGALCVLAVYFLAAEIAGEAAARMASLLTLGSQLIVVLASQYFNHDLAMLFATLFVLFYIRMHKHGRTEDAVLAGGMLSLLLLVRPQVAVPLAIPFAIHWLRFRLPPRAFRDCTMAGAVAGSAWLLFSLYYNAQVTGDAFVSGYARYHGTAMNQLFHRWDDWNAVYRQLRLVLKTLQQLHTHLLLWPTSSLWFVFLLFLLRLQLPYCGLLMAGVATVAASILFIPFSGGLPAGRYLAEVAGLCIVLSAVAIVRLPQWLAAHFAPAGGEASIRPFLYMAIVLLFTVGYLDRFDSFTQFYRYWAQNNYGWGNNPSYRDHIDEMVEKPALILFGDGVSYYTGTLYNPPYDDAPIIAARSFGNDQKLIDMYPGRYVYFGNRDSLKLLRPPLTQ
jgi:hypothetical protein